MQLFTRQSKGLALNEAGREFLQSVRTAMRILDDGIEGAHRHERLLPVGVAAPGELGPLFTPVFARLRADNPTMTFALHEMSDVESLAALLQGRVDVALVAASNEDERLEFVRLPPLRMVVCVASDYLLTPESQVRYGVALDDAGSARDGFPTDADRFVVLRSHQGATVLDAARRGQVAIVLPEVVARLASLAPVPRTTEIPAAQLSVVRRPTINERGAAESVCEAIVACVDELELAAQRDIGGVSTSR